ncbi:hypothetical protein [Streptomyces caniscabiei]|uniref:Uncharacterized protein n=1 Tax=Streptomyces caniscabiei TaxID=2746961 RepID=A0ABU4N0F2_9ACTN|nr:hypothetical protein [Streptomyces caniscabiei]MBE4790366.1 hypothetical protein [Streptomyces caniscabiei]MBE4799531.1 hypothetical protein [Streptomyces caniscabiei]MDX3015224.1 hypothetical protein [Streptomyces caniscabiei]MDX3042539.1 hypothetical protein [Streptomyces caniscabiei]
MPDLTYKQLLRQSTALARQIVRDAEGIRKVSHQIGQEADDTARLSQMIAAMKVDPATVSETLELAKIMRGLSDAAIKYAAGADDTAKAAQATHDETRNAHDGINQAVNSSNVTGIHDVHRDWFTQQ